MAIHRWWWDITKDAENTAKTIAMDGYILWLWISDEDGFPYITWRKNNLHLAVKYFPWRGRYYSPLMTYKEVILFTVSTSRHDDLICCSGNVSDFNLKMQHRRPTKRVPGWRKLLKKKFQDFFAQQENRDSWRRLPRRQHLRPQTE